MKNNNDNEFDDLDKLFQNYRDSLPDFEESEERHNRMLDAVLAKGEEIRRKSINEKKEKANFLRKVRLFWSEFNILEPRYAISVAVLLIVFISIFVLFENNQVNDKTTASNEIPVDSTINVIEDIAQNLETTEPEAVEDVFKNVDFGNFNYDFSVRGSSSSKSSTELEKQIIQIIAATMKEYKIIPTVDGLVVTSGWYLESSVQKQMYLKINKKKKEISFKLIEKNGSADVSLPKVKSFDLKNSIEDRLYFELTDN